MLRPLVACALALLAFQSAAVALDLENGDLAAPKGVNHGEPVVPQGFRVSGDKAGVIRFDAAAPFGSAVAIGAKGKLVREVTLPEPSQPKKIDPKGWYGVASVDVLGVDSDRSTRLELQVVASGSGAVLASAAFAPRVKAARAGAADAPFDRLWVKVRSRRLARLADRKVALVLSAKGGGRVVVDNVRFELFHDEPTRALVGKPNGKNGPDLMASGMLGFLALTEHLNTAFSLLDVREGGPADAAGLKRTDLVVAVEGRPLDRGSLAAGPEWFRAGHEATVGRAIESALAAKRRHVALTVLRDGGARDLKIKLPIRAGFADSFPFDDPMADRLRADITKWIVGNQMPNGFWPGNQAVNGCLAGLALLGTRDRDHAGALRKLVDALLKLNPTAKETKGFSFWSIAFQGIFFCEYYFATGDKRVLAWIDDAIQWLPSTTHPSKWGMQAFGHSPKGLPYGNKALMAPCAHLLVFEALAIRCGVKSEVWEHIEPYVMHSWSDPAKGGHGAMGYNGAAKDKQQFWSRSGLCALALYLRDDRRDMRTALTKIMVERHSFLLNSHAYGEPGGALGLVSLYTTDPRGFAEVMSQWRWRLLNAWQPGFGLRYSSPHMGSPYMGEEAIMNPAYGMLLAIRNGGLVLAGGDAKRWLAR